MRVIKPTFFLTLTMAFVLVYQVGRAQEASTMRFSLQEAIDYALTNNQSVKNAQLEQEIADRKVGEILADGLPQVKANADIGYNYEIQTVFLPGNTFDPSGDPNQTVGAKFGTNYNGNLGLSANQMLFDGTFFIGLKAARTFTQLSQKENIRTSIEVAEAVSKAYYMVLVNRERYTLVERNHSRLDSLLQDTQVMFDNGFAEKIDVNRVKVQFNNASVDKNNFMQLLAVTESLLKFQMGLNPGATIELTSGINELDDFNFEIVNDFSYERRIEYSQLNVQKELNELDIRYVQSGYIPKLDAYFSYGRIIGTQEFGDVFSGSWASIGVVGVKASVPLFDGFKKRRMVQQRRLKAEQLDNAFDMLKNNIDIEIQNALANYKREVEMMRAQKENLALAKEVYDVAKIKYSEGVGSNIEVINADATYKESQVNYYNALYDALISKIDLQKAYGVLL